MKITKKNHPLYYIYSADLETYGNKYYELHNIVKAYSYISKNVYSEVGEITDKDYFSVNKISFLMDLFDWGKELDFKNNRDFWKTGWKKERKQIYVDKKYKEDNYQLRRIIYFHNGGKFDFHFLVEALKEISNKSNDFSMKFFFTKRNEILFMVGELNVDGVKRIVEFRDSYRIFPVSLKAMGQAIGLPKLDYEDYDIIEDFETEESYKNHNNGKSFEYFIRDVDIPNKFLQEVNDILPIKKFKYTIASTAYKLWEETLPIEWRYEYKNSSRYKGNKVATQFSGDDWFVVKKAYRGGITTVNSKYQFKTITNDITFFNYFCDRYKDRVDSVIYRYDVNSLYPSVMLENMPYGKIYEGDRHWCSYKIYEINITYAVVKDKKWPFIPSSKLNFDYIIETLEEPEALETFVKEKDYPKIIDNKVIYLNNYEYDFFKESYNGEWEAQVIRSVREKESPFKAYISKWMKVKQDNNDRPALRLLAKLFLNALYGKFGQKIENEYFKGEIFTEAEAREKFKITDNAIWKINKDGIRRRVTKNNNFYIYVDDPKEIEIIKAKYIPIAEKITSLARIKLLEAINLNFLYFVYADTDSIHLTRPAMGIVIDKLKLGAWKFEGVVKFAVYRRPKHYINIDINELNGKPHTPYKITGGGFNVGRFNDNNELFTKIVKDYVNKKKFTVEKGKTEARIVNGGVLIREKEYIFNMPHNWKEVN